MTQAAPSVDELVGRFRSEQSSGRPLLVSQVLAANRDSFRCILAVAATRSIDEQAFDQGLQFAIEQDRQNLPALRLLAWHQIRKGRYAEAKETLQSFIACWPKVPDTRRELARVSMMSPGPDGAEILRMAASELRNPLADSAYTCQHMLASSQTVPAAKVNELRLNIDRAFAEIVRGSTSADNMPTQSVFVFFEVLKKLIAAKSIVLVANGPSLSGSLSGAAIDAHDVVIRCNFPVFSRFSEDVGRRVDIVFFNESLVPTLPEMLTREPQFKECLSLAFHPEPGPLFDDQHYARNMNDRVSKIPPKLREFYRSFFYTRPTTGLMGIILISVLLGKDLSIFGFDFYEQAMTHYYPSTSPVFLGHELQYEKWFLKHFIPWLDLGKPTS